MVKQKMEAVRRARVRQLFGTRHPYKPTVNDVLAFYGWLKDRFPQLLPKEIFGDLYQHLKLDLGGLFEG
jgi:hypothetical protein